MNNQEKDDIGHKKQNKDKQSNKAKHTTQETNE
jgi:hypothetical protein